MTERSTPESHSLSRSATPIFNTVSRFTSQNATAEDLLKSETVGLVQLSDFRKRRAEVLERKDRESHGSNSSNGSGAATPTDR